MAEGNKGGRPRLYTDDLADEICRIVACTPKSLPDLCDMHSHWPKPDTIYMWRRENINGFFDKYARAKIEQIEPYIDEIIKIADDKSEDYFVDDKGEMHFDKEHVQRSRLRIDTRKWLAAKLVPRLYGNKLTDTPEGEALMLKILEKL